MIIKTGSSVTISLLLKLALTVLLLASLTALYAGSAESQSSAWPTTKASIAAEKVYDTKGHEYMYQMDPIPPRLQSARFHLWIPDSVGPTGKIRGVIATSGYNYGLMPEIFRAPHWRALAAELHMALYLHRAEESDRKHAGSPGQQPGHY